MLRRLYNTRVFRWYLRKTGRTVDFLPKLLDQQTLADLHKELDALRGTHGVVIEEAREEDAGMPSPADADKVPPGYYDNKEDQS